MRTKSKYGIQFANPEELEVILDKYLAECKRLKMPPNMSGVAYVCGISRTKVFEYTKKPEYVDIFTHFSSSIENFTVDAAMQGKVNERVAMFVLKNNHNYVEKQEIKQEVTNNTVHYSPTKDNDN